MKCYSCGAENAYQGLYSIECINLACKNFSAKQRDICLKQIDKKIDEKSEEEMISWDYDPVD